MFTVSHAVLSDRGLHHDDNEDRWCVDAASGLYAVSDGMAEAKSPQLAVDALPELVRAALPAGSDLAALDAAGRVRQAVAELSRRVRAAQQKDAGMIGATLVLAVVRDGGALVVHLGDSRAYLYRDGQLEALTRDHSRVQKMLDLGIITAAEAAAARGNGGPTRCLGMAVAVADVRHVPLQAGDRLLLCSDGLMEMVPDADIAAALADGPALPLAAARLVDAANAAGGRDNVTVVLVEVEAV